MVRSWQARYIFILKITLLCVMGISMGQLIDPYYHHHDMIEPSYRYHPYNPMMPFHHVGPHFHHFPDKTMHDMIEPSYRYQPYNPTMSFHHVGPHFHHFPDKTMHDLDLHGPFYKSNPHPPTMPIHSMPPELPQVGSNDINPSIPADTCQLQMDPGSCSDMLPRYFYDINARECQLFTYGGCHGNANNFITLEECENACLGHVTHMSFRTYPHIMGPSYLDHDLHYRLHQRPRHCYLPKEVGPCMEAHPRWHYNPLTRSCEKFHFGGCEGNANNFETPGECKHICQAHAYYLL